MTNKLIIEDSLGNLQSYNSLSPEVREQFLNTQLLVYICEGEEAEIKEWFKTINIAGIPLNEQELLNAIYSGPFVTALKRVFSNSQNAFVDRWSSYMSGALERQFYLATALGWVSQGKIPEYMGLHRRSSDISEVVTHFNTVIDWIDSTFLDIYPEMRNLDWGELYRRFHGNAYDAEEVSARVRELMGDDFVTNRRGVFEYVLGGEEDVRLLNARCFDTATKRRVYERQTEEAKAKGESNCPLCAQTEGPNAARVWGLQEMEADHVRAWSRGGATDAKNCQLLCKLHNRMKGNL